MTEIPGPTKLTGANQLAYCTCMQSAHWPHCDATHHTVGGNGPEIIELEKDKTYMLCRCFKSKNKPFCDGSHI
jgi:CDGSH-type Zn-finger protein